MDILFLACSMYNDPFAWEWRPDLRYTISYLRRNQVEADYLYIPVLERAEQITDIYGEALPNLVYIDISEENCAGILRFLEDFKRHFPHEQVIAGGVPSFFAPQAFLEEHRQIDYILTGERELPLLDAARQTRQNGSLAEIQGLHSREFSNPPRVFIPDLDELGHMAQDGLSAMLAGQEGASRTAYLASSRGCYARCGFCSVPDLYPRSLGSPWRGRSAEAVVDEMEELHRAFHISRFIFEDDNFIGPGAQGHERVRAIAGEILRRKLPIQYFACCRLNDIRAETLSIMKEAGLSGLGLSVESTSQASLDLLQKGFKTEIIYPTLKLIEDMEIPCQVNLIFFDPYTTLPGVRSNLALLEYLRDSPYLSYSSAFPFNELKPFPWSRIAARLKAGGLLDEQNNACQYRDVAVECLVHFTRRIKQRLPLTFKKTMLFDALDGLPDENLRKKKVEAFNHLVAGLRHWVGLSVLPRYIGAAADILEEGMAEQENGSWKQRLDALEEDFQTEVDRLQLIEQKILEQWR